MPEHIVPLVHSSARRDRSVTRQLAETPARRPGDRVTTRDPAGGVGLRGGRKACILVSWGGVPAGSAARFATPCLRHLLRFVGIEDVEVIDDSAQLVGGEAAPRAARSRAGALTAKKAA